MFLRANKSIQNVFKSIDNKYNNMVQGGSQYMANLNQKGYDHTKSRLMEQGQRHYQNFHNAPGNATSALDRMSLVSGEKILDRRLAHASVDYNNRHQQISRAQNYLTSDGFKSNAVNTLGVAAGAGVFIGSQQ